MRGRDSVDVRAEEGEIHHDVKELEQNVRLGFWRLERVVSRRTLSKMSSVQEPSAMMESAVNCGCDKESE